MPIPRKRSCAQCRRAKARCSLTGPKCSRCISKTLDCDYTDALPRPGNLGLASSLWQGVETSAEPHSVAASTPEDPVAISVQDDPALEQVDMTFLDIEGTVAMQWDSEVEPMRMRQFPLAAPEGRDHGFDPTDPFTENGMPWFDWTAAQNVPTSEPQKHRIRTQTPNLPESRDDISQEAYVAELSKKLSTTDFAAPPWPSPQRLPTKMKNLLGRRSIDKLASNLTGNYLFTTVQSYPEMLSTPNFPPFVHRYFAAKDTDIAHINQNPNLPEPLANCVSFMAMLRNKTPASNKFVMKTLFIEAQRLHNEFLSFDEWTKLAAMQALAVYTILVASEGDRCITLSAVIVLAMGEIAAAMSQWAVVSESESKGVYPSSWDEWRFIESKRRTLTLLWLLELLLDMNMGAVRAHSCRTLDEIPLPSNKGLWEAPNKVVWEQNYFKYLSSRKTRDMLKIGDLRAAQRSDAGQLDKSLVEDLNFWSSNADSFGGLIMMAIR